RAAYLDRVRGFVRDLEAGCGQMHVDYVPICTREPFEVALSNYLAARQSRGR
ncbi:unnamed protein product, partial [marine sediment metagenome]